MNDLLQNPAVQAGLAPFVTGLVVAAILWRSRFVALAQMVAFATIVWLAVGFSFDSLTATRKLVLLGGAVGLCVLALELAPPERARHRALHWGIAVLLGAGAVWMLWRLLAQRESVPELVFAALLAAGYVAAMTVSTLRVGARDPVAASSAALMVGLGTGALAMLGASASLAQIAIALGVGAGAVLLVQMVAGRPSRAATAGLPGTAIAAMAGVLVVFAGALQWYCLLPVLAAPWMARAFGSRPSRVWLAACGSSALALVPMLVATGLAWAAVHHAG